MTAHTKFLLRLFFILIQVSYVFAAPEIVDHSQLMDHGDGHLMDMQGAMVMGQNKDKLPGGCDKVSEDRSITVSAGRKYAAEFPGTIYGFDQHSWKVKPCTRLTVTFVNEDSVRHQWMVHGLPKYIYDKGMFHLEVTGPGKVAGTFIVPAEDKTYLVHCDMAQHMEKGLKGELVIGKGSGDLPSIPGISPPVIADSYDPAVIAASFAKSAPLPSGNASAPSKQSLTSSDGSKRDVGEKSSYPGLFLLGAIAGVCFTPWVSREVGVIRSTGKPSASIVAGIERVIILFNRVVSAIRSRL